MKFVVFGAGAVGSALGGMLSIARHDVLLVCRPEHAAHIARDGLRLRSSTGDHVAHPSVATSLSANAVTEDTIVFVTVKMPGASEALECIAAAVPRATPIVCVQNGIGGAEAAAERFDRVYAGIFRMTCSAIQPGGVSFRKIGRVVIGRFPKGVDPLAKAIASALAVAGFDSAASRNISADRWLKLALNTQTVFNAVIDPRDHDANEFFEIKARILEETARVFKAAKIRARSCDGRDPSIADMVAELRRPQAKRVPHGVNVHNSLWQDLYLRRTSVESRFVHGPLIELGASHRVPTPYNEVALQLAGEACAAAAGPETLRVAEALARIEAGGS